MTDQPGRHALPLHDLRRAFAKLAVKGGATLDLPFAPARAGVAVA